MSIERKIRWVLLAVSLTSPASSQAAQVTVDDLMRLSSVSDVRISPDGNQVAYVVSTPSLETASHEAVLYRIPAAGGTSLRLTYNTRIFNKPLPSPWLRWSPDGSLLSFVAYVGDVPQVMAMYPTGGEPWVLTSVKEGVTRFEWSPDGKQIALIALDPPPPEDEERKRNKSFVIHVDKNKRPPRLWVQAIPGGAPRAISPAEETVVDFHWAPDGKSLVFAGSNETGFQAPYNSGVYTISISGGEPRAIVRRPGTNRMPQYSPDGRSIAFISSGGKPGMINAQDLYVVAADGTSGAPPPGYQHGQRIPMLVYCHGGPIGGYTYGIFPQFAHIPGQVDPYPVEAMASAGMAILFPMPRGGSGYGIAGFRAIINRWGEDDYKDIMAGVNAMIAQGIADPDRLGVMGASYGGYMTDWIVTQTARFKAASTAASVSDLINLYYFSDAGDTVAEYFGYPWEDAASMIQHSAITHVQNVSTPLLIQHRENDNRVPLSEAQEFYKALKTLNKTVEFDVYPRGGHVNFEPPLEREYMLRNLEWFKRWLKPDSNSR